MGLWKDPRRGDWRWEFQCRGQRYTGAGYKKKSEARTAREDKRQEVEKDPTPTGMDFETAGNLYLDYSKRRHAKKTYRYKDLVMKRFLEYQGNLAIQEITPHHIHTYLSTRPTNRNYNAHMAELCAFFTFCQKQLKLIHHHPCWDLEPMPHTPERKEIPTEEDIIKLLLAADPETEKPLLLIILHTLARVDEVLRLTWKDVNFEKREITLWTRKRKGGSYQPDSLHMNNDLYAVLWHLWKIRKQELWVIYNEKTGTRYTRRPKMMKGVCKRAKIKPFGFHGLRHFIATYLADSEKISKKTISGILRHRALGTTEIYLHSVEKTMVDAMKKLEGKFVGAFVTSPVKGHKTPTASQSKPLKPLVNNGLRKS